MDNLKVFASVMLAVVLVVSGVFLYTLNKVADSNLGGVVSYGNSGGQANLYGSLASMLQDIYNVRVTLAGTVASSTTWNPVSLSAGEVATTSFTGLGASIAEGDLCFAVLASSSLDAAGSLPIVNCKIDGTGTAVVQLLSPSSTMDYATSTLYIRALDLGTFIAPAALGTTSSTDAND